MSGVRRDRLLTGRGLLVVSLLTAVSLAVDTPAAEAAETADCPRGENLGFEEPEIDGEDIDKHEDSVKGWETNATNGIIRLSEDSSAPEGDQYVAVNPDVGTRLFQSFPTLPGDIIRWQLRYDRSSRPKRTDYLDLGATTGFRYSWEAERELPSNASWETIAGDYEVGYTGRTFLTFGSKGDSEATETAYIDDVRLLLKCGISLTANASFSDVDDSDDTNAGDMVTFDYVATNVGEESVGWASLWRLALTANAGPAAVCRTKDGEATTAETVLKPEGRLTCTGVHTLTEKDVSRGSVVGSALISASDATLKATHEVSASASVTAQIPSIAIVRTATLNMMEAGRRDRVDVGDKVFHSFKVTNTGNVTLNEVSVRDSDGGRVTCTKTSLPPGAVTKCNARYGFLFLWDHRDVTETDIEAGVIEGTATVTAVSPEDAKASAKHSVSLSLDADMDVPPRLDGKDRYGTAAEISKETFPSGVDAVYAATGVNFPDALAGSAASGGDGPILLVTKHAIPAATSAELKRLKPRKIIVLGGTGVVSTTVERALKAFTSGKVTRQAGSDRYSTAAAISAKHFDPGADVAFVATGTDFPDALTGGPAAAKLGGPILLTQKGKLPAATIGELRRLKPKRIVVLGGTGVVSAAVEKTLGRHTAGKVTRLAGADRYSTGGAISKYVFDSGVPVAYVATGANFPDALAGGAAGAFRDGPVLLVAGGKIPGATIAELRRLKPKRIVVLGGTGVVPKTVEKALAAYMPKTS